ARQPGDDDELIPRYLEVDGLQVVLARAPDDDAVAGHGPTIIPLPADGAQRGAARAPRPRANARKASLRNFFHVYPSGYTGRQWRSSGTRSAPSGFARSASRSSLFSSWRAVAPPRRSPRGSCASWTGTRSGSISETTTRRCATSAWTRPSSTTRRA